MMNEVSFHDAASNHESTSNEADKHYKERDLSKTYSFRIAARTLRPPKSRRRIIIAPLMEKPTLENAKAIPVPEVIQKSPVQACVYREEEEDLTVGDALKSGDGTSAWISKRKKLRHQLANFGNMKKWLERKTLLTEIEVNVQDQLEAERLRSKLTSFSEPQQESTLPEVKSIRGHLVTPSIQRPCPDALMILDSYLHDNRLRLVDLYNRTDKSKNKKISLIDLKAVQKEANLPLNDTQLDDLVIFLGAKDADSINYKELAVGWKTWRHESLGGLNPVKKHKPGIREPSLSQGVTDVSSEKAPQPFPDPPHSAQRSPGPSRGVSPKSQGPGSSLSSAKKSALLEVPPTSLEEGRPLSYEDMEEIGKMYKDRRRLWKSKSRMLNWVDQCWIVRSGNVAIDRHSLPSTLGPPNRDEVNLYRRQVLMEFMNILELCRKYNVSLSEQLLEKALLYPGDKLIMDAKLLLKLRQPATSQLSAAALRTDLSAEAGDSLEERTSFSTSAAFGKPLTNGLAEDEVRLRKHWESYTDSPQSSVSPYPQRKYAQKVKEHVRGQSQEKTCTVNCWTTFEDYQEMTKNLKRKFPNARPASGSNAFWPGHLLDKLRLYLPNMTRTPAEAVFANVTHKKGSYPAIYHNERSWLVSDQGYVTYGGFDTRNRML